MAYMGSMASLAMLGLQNPQQLAQMAAARGVHPSILLNAVAAAQQQAATAPQMTSVGAALAGQQAQPAGPTINFGLGPAPAQQPQQGQQQPQESEADKLVKAFGLLQATQPPAAQQAPIAPAIAPPSGRGGPDPNLTALLTQLLQPQGQVGAIPTLGQLIAGGR